MKILLVNAHGADLAYGGAERYVHDLRDGLERRGDACAVLSAFPVRADRSSELRVLHRTDWREDRVRRYRNHVEDWVAPAGDRLRDVIAEAAPDVVHTNNLFGITTGIWQCARSLGIPVVHTLHDYQLLCPRTSLLRRDGTPCRPSPLLCGLRTRRLGRWAPAVSEVIGVSAYVLRRHDGFFAATTPRHVIHPPLAPLSSGAPVPPPGERLTTLGFIGALDLHKGVGVLLEAAPRLAGLGVRVRIAGGGPMADAVAAAPGIAYVGRLVGDAAPAFIASCDAGVVPSLWDEPGLTFAALEWLGGGRPVLATARGGLAELAAGGVARLSGTADDLVARVSELRAGPAWSRLRAEVPRVADDHDRTRWLEQHRGVYARARSATLVPAA